jgi:hypothetical protein
VFVSRGAVLVVVLVEVVQVVEGSRGAVLVVVLVAVAQAVEGSTVVTRTGEKVWLAGGEIQVMDMETSEE